MGQQPGGARCPPITPANFVAIVTALQIASALRPAPLQSRPSAPSSSSAQVGGSRRRRHHSKAGPHLDPTRLPARSGCAEFMPEIPRPTASAGPLPMPLSASRAMPCVSRIGPPPRPRFRALALLRRRLLECVAPPRQRRRSNLHRRRLTHRGKVRLPTTEAGVVLSVEVVCWRMRPR